MVEIIQQFYKEALYRLVWDSGIDVVISWGWKISGRDDCNVPFPDDGGRDQLSSLPITIGYKIKIIMEELNKVNKGNNIKN